MANMNTKVYRAFRAAGVSEEQAEEAAEAIAEHENRFSKIDSRLAVIPWMVGANTAALMYLVLRTVQL